MMAPKYLHRVDENDTATRISLKATALDCPFKSLDWLRRLYNDAERLLQRGDHSAMRQFVRDQKVEQYRDSGAKTNTSTAGLSSASARSTYYRDEVPSWCTGLVISVDVQSDRIYWMALGFDLERFAIIGWGERYYLRKDERDLGKDITDPAREKVLDSVYADFLQSGLSLENDSGKRRADAMVIDVGHEGQCVSRWVNKHPRCYCVRGQDSNRKVGSQGAIAKTYADGMLTKRKLQKRPLGYPMHWWWVSTDDVRIRTHDALQMAYDTYGSIALPLHTPADDYLLQHLTAWELQTDPDTGKSEWVKRRKRDDYDDCLCYGWSFADYLREIGTCSDPAEPEGGPYVARGFHDNAGPSEFGGSML